MDIIDRKIVAALMADGRLTNQELSERVGLSPSPCLLRVVSDSLKSYERFVREVLSALPGIASIQSSFAFSQLKQRPALPPPPSADR